MKTILALWTLFCLSCSGVFLACALPPRPSGEGMVGACLLPPAEHEGTYLYGCWLEDSAEIDSWCSYLDSRDPEAPVLHILHTSDCKNWDYKGWQPFSGGIPK